MSKGKVNSCGGWSKVWTDSVEVHAKSKPDLIHVYRAPWICANDLWHRYKLPMTTAGVYPGARWNLQQLQIPWDTVKDMTALLQSPTGNLDRIEKHVLEGSKIIQHSRKIIHLLGVGLDTAVTVLCNTILSKCILLLFIQIEPTSFPYTLVYSAWSRFSPFQPFKSDHLFTFQSMKNLTGVFLLDYPKTNVPLPPKGKD